MAVEILYAKIVLDLKNRDFDSFVTDFNSMKAEPLYHADKYPNDLNQNAEFLLSTSLGDGSPEKIEEALTFYRRVLDEVGYTDADYKYYRLRAKMIMSNRGTPETIQAALDQAEAYCNIGGDNTFNLIKLKLLYYTSANLFDQISATLAQIPPEIADPTTSLVISSSTEDMPTGIAAGDYSFAYSFSSIVGETAISPVTTVTMPQDGGVFVVEPVVVPEFATKVNYYMSVAPGNPILIQLTTSDGESVTVRNLPPGRKPAPSKNTTKA